MGCGSSTVQQQHADAATREFDRILEEERAEAALHFKLLTLGAGESGKSTIIKQLVFLHKPAPLSEEEKAAYVRVLHGNVLTCINTLLTEARSFGYRFSEAHQPLVDLVDAFDSHNLLTPEVADAIHTLWSSSEALARTYERRSEFWLLEGVEFFFSNIFRFTDSEYSPTEEDIVYARKRTTGVVETQLKYGSVHWSVVDVGGQRSERRKWINSFDNVKGIMYCVNLAGFCSVLFEDRSVNRMQESLSLFRETMANPLFANTPVFLILNKKDLFEKLIETRPLTMAFPEYTGPNELRPCIEYIATRFASVLPPDRPKPLVLLMAARVKKDVQYCFEDVKDTLLDLNRKGIRRAQAKLDALRERFRNEQLEEMEQRAAEKKRQEDAAEAARRAAEVGRLAQKLPSEPVLEIGKDSSVATETVTGTGAHQRDASEGGGSGGRAPGSGETPAPLRTDSELEHHLDPATEHPTPSTPQRQAGGGGVTLPGEVFATRLDAPPLPAGDSDVEAEAARRAAEPLVVQELSHAAEEQPQQPSPTPAADGVRVQQIEAQ